MKKTICAIASVMLALFVSSPLWAQYGPIGLKQISVTQEQAIMKVLELYDNQDVDVFLGTKGRWLSLVYPPVPETGTYIPTTWAVVVDEHPGKGWQHDYKTYSVVMNQTVPQSCDTFSYSVIPNSIQSVYNIEPVDAKNRYGYRANSKINLNVGNVPTNTVAGNTYAVILNASSGRFFNRERYWNDCSFVYQALRKRYQIAKSHISVLMADGSNASTDMLKADGSAFISSPTAFASDTPDNFYPATKAKLDSVFNSLALNMTSSDHLFVCITGDGGVDATGTYASLWGGEKLYAAHLDSLLSQFDIRVANVLLAQSYGGGFLNTLQGNNRVITAAYGANELSVSSSSIPFDDFIYYWSCAVSGKNLYGTTINADSDNNGRITMEEAYLYARNQVSGTSNCVVGRDAPVLSFNHIPKKYDLYMNYSRIMYPDNPPETYVDTVYSSDFWARKQNDGIMNHISQPIPYNSNPGSNPYAYLYYQVHNQGIEALEDDSCYLHIYMATSNHFHTKEYQEPSYLADNLSSLVLRPVEVLKISPTILPGDSVIVTEDWYIPDSLLEVLDSPSSYTRWLRNYIVVCISNSRVSSDVSEGMTVADAIMLAKQSDKVTVSKYLLEGGLVTSLNNLIQNVYVNGGIMTIYLTEKAQTNTKVLIRPAISGVGYKETTINEGDTTIQIDVSNLSSSHYVVGLFESGQLVDSRQVATP